MMGKYVIGVMVMLSLSACGNLALQDISQDMPAATLEQYQSAGKTIVDENVWGIPLLWFNADNVKKIDSHYGAGLYTQGPLLSFMSGAEGHFDEQGKLKFYAGWRSYLWGALGSCFKRKYLEDGQWKEDKHIGFLFDAFGHAAFGGEKYCFVLFIPIPVGD